MILDTNTGIDPDTVVIIPFNTLITDSAMLRPWSLYNLAIRTDISGVYIL